MCISRILSWFKDNLLTPILALATVSLALSTWHLANETKEMVGISSKAFKLNSKPMLFFSDIIEGKEKDLIYFKLRNGGYSTAKNITLDFLAKAILYNKNGEKIRKQTIEVEGNPYKIEKLYPQQSYENLLVLRLPLGANIKDAGIIDYIIAYSTDVFGKKEQLEEKGRLEYKKAVNQWMFIPE